MAEKSAQALASSLHQKEEAAAPFQVNAAVALGTDSGRLDNVPLNAPGTMDEQFPNAELGAPDKRDREMAAKLSLQQPGQPGYTAFGKLEAKDSDFEWFQKKAAAAEEANFQAWFAEEFDHMNPAMKKRAKELFPQFYAQRMKTLDKNAETLKKLWRIRLEGVQDFSDLQLKYLADSGRIHLPFAAERFEDYPAGTAARRSETENINFVRGLLSPFKVFGPQASVAGESDLIVRTADRSRAFGGQPAGPSGVSFGLSRGFPSFGGTQAQQGDADWYRKLSSVTWGQ